MLDAYIVDITVPITKANKAYHQVTVFPFFPYATEAKNVEIHWQ